MFARQHGRYDLLRSGMTRARASLQVVNSHPRLVVVPTITILTGALVFVPVLWGLNRGGRSLIAAMVRAFGPLGLAGIPIVFVFAAWLFITVYAMLVLFTSAVLVACTRQILNTDSVSLSSGTRAAAEVMPQIILFALAIGAIGLLLAALERMSDGLGDLVASTLGASVAVLTFFIVPAAVLDGANTVEAFRRSVETVRGAFGETTVLSLGVVGATMTLFSIPWIIAVLAVPLVGTDQMSSLIEARPLLYGGIPAFSLWVGVVAGVSLGAITKTDLYVAVREEDDSVPLLGVSVDEVVDAAD